MNRASTTVRVRYGETDQMGFVYHANYLVWCEIGRTEYMRELGLPYAELESRGVFLTVSEASVRYGAPARYDDEVRVETWVEAVRSRAVTFGYEIHRADPDPVRLARATTTLISMDADGGTRKLPDEVLELFRS
jgi:acyl-CoA thioester hydrolase